MESGGGGSGGRGGGGLRGGCSLWDSLVLSKRRTCKSLVSFISQRVPELAVPASIIATATPDKASVALEILAEHPTVALDGEAALAPLLADDNKKLLALLATLNV